VNTTILGMVGQPPLSINLDARHRWSWRICLRAVDNAAADDGEGQGAAHGDGLGMLLHQAVGGFERWFGVKPE